MYYISISFYYLLRDVLSQAQLKEFLYTSKIIKNNYIKLGPPRCVIALADPAPDTSLFDNRIPGTI